MSELTYTPRPADALYLCEGNSGLCGNNAPIEHVAKDEDGDVYTTFTCILHAPESSQEPYGDFYEVIGSNPYFDDVDALDGSVEGRR